MSRIRLYGDKSRNVYYADVSNISKYKYSEVREGALLSWTRRLSDNTYDNHSVRLCYSGRTVMVVDLGSSKSKMAFVPSLCLCAYRSRQSPSLESARESIIVVIILLKQSPCSRTRRFYLYIVVVWNLSITFYSILMMTVWQYWYRFFVRREVNRFFPRFRDCVASAPVLILWSGR